MGFPTQNISGRFVIGQEKNLLPQNIYPDLYQEWPNIDNHEVYLSGENEDIS